MVAEQRLLLVSSFAIGMDIRNEIRKSQILRG